MQGPGDAEKRLAPLMLISEVCTYYMEPLVLLLGNGRVNNVFLIDQLFPGTQRHEGDLNYTVSDRVTNFKLGHTDPKFYHITLNSVVKRPFGRLLHKFFSFLVMCA